MTLRIMHVGVGIRGQHWLEFVKGYPDMVSVACIDVDNQALETVRNQYGTASCQYFTNLETALRHVPADVALIASPTELHATHALQALEANLAVMIEKPFADSLEAAQRVVQRGEELGKPIIVAEQFRFVRTERTVRMLVDNGLLGTLVHATLVDRRRMPSTTQGAWMAKLDHVQLREIAVHHFDSLRSFFRRRPLSMTARVWNPPWSDYHGGACTEGLIELEGGLDVTYVGSLTSHRFGYQLWIEGEQGVLWTNRKMVFWRPRGKRFFWPVKMAKVPKGDDTPFPKEGSTSLLKSVRDAVLSGTPPETSGRDNLWTLAMVHAGIRSANEQRTIPIDQVFPNAGLPA